jgi:hypothetical protein
MFAQGTIQRQSKIRDRSAAFDILHETWRAAARSGLPGSPPIYILKIAHLC